KRLSRRGLALSSGLLVVLDPSGASASVPVSLVVSTVRSATLLTAGPVGAGAISARVAALTRGVAKAMLQTQVKTLTAVLLTVGVAGVGVGILTHQTAGARDAASDGTARVRDTASGRGTLTLEGHTGPVCSVGVTPDGKRLVTGCMDGTVRLWDAESGRQLLTLQGHTGAVWSVA